jgi:iron complex outermembrane recepter protein
MNRRCEGIEMIKNTVQYAERTALQHRCICIAILSTVVASGSALAQTSEPPAPPQKIETIVVTDLGNAGAPYSVIAGEVLQQRRRATLGETLAGVPGLSASYFGPNASRPIVRGLDSERVLILESGASSADAASLSPDHAVPIEPFALDRIELLRGPVALLYGSAALGGVVNTVSQRIPKQRFNVPQADVLTQWGGAEREALVAARLNASAGAFSTHLDASSRETDDLRVPRFTRTDGASSARVVNSAQTTQSAALGASMVGTDGYLGLSANTYRSRYGVVVEDDVTIDMKRDKLSLEGSKGFDGALIREITGYVTASRYQHQEIEGSGAVGTTFSNNAEAWRLQAQTRRYGPWQSTLGASGEHTRFSAIGAEAFVPPSDTTSAAVFAMQQATFGGTMLAMAARLESTRVRTREVATEEGGLRFGSADKKRASLRNVSFAATQPLTSYLTLQSNLSYSERAPSYFERYADGVHLATGAYERGDRTLPKETSTQVDLGLTWKRNKHSAQFTAFAARYKNFIALEATGETFAEVHEDGERLDVPIYAFRAVPARITGVEGAASVRLIDGRSTLDVTGKLDAVRATNTQTREPLPRIAPIRFTLGADYAQEAWGVRGEIVHALRQSRIPAEERYATAAGDGSTPAFTLLNVAVSHAFTWSALKGNVFLRLNNLSNALAYNASSIRTVRELAPLPGRSARIGIELKF